MKERPILFSGPMVRAILEGRKTMARRVVKPQPDESVTDFTCRLYSPTKVDRHGMEYPGEDVFGFATEDAGWVCPYGQPGDRLWVRETFMPMPHLNAKAYFRATDPLVGGKWKPSIFMPKALSRITLEVTGVRVERVQEISGAGVVLEGLYPNPLYPHAELYTWDGVNGNSTNPIYAYHLLWDSINAKRGFGWYKNPWVWVISFKRINI